MNLTPQLDADDLLDIIDDLPTVDDTLPIADFDAHALVISHLGSLPAPELLIDTPPDLRAALQAAQLPESYVLAAHGGWWGVWSMLDAYADLIGHVRTHRSELTPELSERRQLAYLTARRSGLRVAAEGVEPAGYVDEAVNALVDEAADILRLAGVEVDLVEEASASRDA